MSTQSFLEQKIMEVYIKIYGQSVNVEVSVKVGEYLDRADHKIENLFHEQRRHWDGHEFNEYIVAHEVQPKLL